MGSDGTENRLKNSIRAPKAKGFADSEAKKEAIWHRVNRLENIRSSSPQSPSLLDHGSVLLQGNCEGPATVREQPATVLVTTTFVGGGKSGTYSSCSQVYLDDGEVVRADGSGSYESVGKHRWRTQGFVQSSTGDSAVNDGEIDLASRSWTGKLLEKI